MQLLSLLGSMAYYVPIMVVLIVGIVLTAKARREYGRAATLGMAGCIVLLLTTIVEGGRNLALPTLVSVMRGQLYLFVSVSGVLFALLHSAGIALLIAAAVTRRTDGRTAPPQNPQPPWPPDAPWRQPPQPPTSG